MLYYIRKGKGSVHLIAQFPDLLIIQSISIALPTERAYKAIFSPSAKYMLATPL